MKYFYYAGCSLEGTAAEYDTSTRAVLRELGAELMEIEDWSCCGASAAESASYLLSMVLPARNIALASRTGIEADFVVPCSACYLNLRRVGDHVHRDEALAQRINEVLSEEGLTYQKGLKTRHLLDVLANDFSCEDLDERARRKLSGFKVAPYYGCQCLRPYRDFDDPQQPASMDPLIEALGAQVHPWSAGARCCGAGLMTTKKNVALRLVGDILSAARGADCIVTVCPMCQMNLESFQSKISRERGEKLDISILYLPQLLGLAFGISDRELNLHMNLALTEPFLHKLRTITGC